MARSVSDTQDSVSTLGEDGPASGPTRTYSQARHWMLTIPRGDWTPHLPEACAYVKGQAEIGEGTSYEHWQVYVVTKKKLRLRGIKSIFGRSAHCEPTRTEAARDYVWKESTRIEG